MTFNEKYSKILSVVKEYIDKINLYNCIDVQEPLKTELSRILNAPSKRIRPLVSFLCLKAIGAEINEKQIRYQTAIELVHNASLIHDDVIDNSEIRRNRKTLNKELDSKIAVITGDYLLSLAMKMVIDIGISELVDIFCDTLKVMAKGEISQYFDRYKITTLDKYIGKTEQKTAKLFETSLLGSLYINGDIDQNLLNFAHNFGIAFQICDDLKNCLTSKSDINEGVYTAPVIYSGSVEISNVGIEKTKILINNYLEQAEKSLRHLDNNKYNSALAQLLELYKNGQN